VVKAKARAAFDAGLAAYAAKDYENAIVYFNRALEQRHDFADAHNNLGLSCLALGRIEDAVDAFALAIHFRPLSAHSFHNLALAELQRCNFREALCCLERAIGLDPAFASAHNTLGHVLTHQTGDLERGARHIRQALALSPGDPDILCNLSAVLTQEGRAKDAIETCDKLLAADADMHEARLNRGLALLKLGRFDEGWRDYEARKLARGNYEPRALTLREWRGEPLADKKILVYAEQGIGDQIMFASCVPGLMQHAAHCTIECAPQLRSLFARAFPAALVLAQSNDPKLMQDARAAGVDYQVAIGSLPAQLRQRREDFSDKGAYLRADPARISIWRRRLEALGPGPKVGVSWAGGAASTGGARRSTRLADWAPILENERCHFISLQYGDAGALTGARPGRLNIWPDALETYDETAALVAALDLVITVQTALVHLAGALGRPAWVMVQAACEWRYGEHHETMPWYPSIRLVRQTEAQAWEPVIAQIARDLAKLSAR
jgi:tetratricopeptide (TPR) repeat protein